MRSPPRRLCVLLPQRHELLGQPLRLLCLVPCCRYRFVLEERCDEVAQKCLPMRRRPAQGAVLHVAARHDGSWLSGVGEEKSGAMLAQHSSCRWSSSNREKLGCRRTIPRGAISLHHFSSPYKWLLQRTRRETVHRFPKTRRHLSAAHPSAHNTAHTFTHFDTPYTHIPTLYTFNMFVFKRGK
jgi:hypothetical protein